MTFKPFTRKQLIVLSWWNRKGRFGGYDGIICDGAVRSGKTFCMSISFVAWSFYAFREQSFAICGKTVSSLRRNVITPMLPVLQQLGFSCTLKLSQNLLSVKRDGVENRFYLFGGRDESSAALIQGITLAGVMLDEVALMPRSFVEQALARCSVSGSKFWFNCNPEYPQHWFHQEWILKAREKNMLYLHFVMDDNPSLSPAILQRYKRMYSGPFYERFVLGKWSAAQGLVYPMFNETNTFSGNVEPCAEYYISCDYGTVNPTSMGLWGLKDGVWHRLKEDYYSSRRHGVQLTDEEYYERLLDLAEERRVSAVIVDPSAASFIACIRRHGRFSCIPAKNDVLSGIRRVCDALKSGRILIGESCADAIREFGSYRWSEGGADVPVKQNDHAMDDIRYFVSTALDSGDSFFALSAERN